MNIRIITPLLCLTIFCAISGLGQNNPASAANADSTLLSVSGTVEIAKTGTTSWAGGHAGEALKPGDRVRTAKNSRATVRLSNLSLLRVHELTTLEIQPPSQPSQNPTLDLKGGTVYFFNRDKPQTTEFRTPSASGAIRGTEFNLAVAEDGRMLLTLVDGEVNVQNELGSLELKTGEQAMAEPGKAPQKTPSVDAINIIQWTLYYPGVVDVDELGLSDDLKIQLAPSLEAYRAGDLLKAVDSYPWDRESQSPEDKVYRAALSLAAGKVDQCQGLLQNLGEGRAPAFGAALKELIAAVKHQEYNRDVNRTLASEWLAGSYYHQSRGDLELALEAARAAAVKSPNFGYAHERVAELEFSFGHTDAALAALNRSLELSPRNAQALAVKGFLLAAQNKIHEARSTFDNAIETDGNLGNGWLGRGLVKIKKGDVDGGRKDIETAAAVEPNRAIFRSYLGKAWSQGRLFGIGYRWNKELATKELRLAKELDPNDPTSWLYSALLNQERNQVNSAVEDLEKSKELNDNRRIFRSKLLLDQDKAVRSANLASVYRDAGMTEYSVREATRAVDADPANFSSHLFLSDSYDALRDPRAINLRYETPWLNELLLANLLAPVGAGNLSQNISQQEYSRLFETDRLGISSFTEYWSSGDWRERASQYGTIGNSSYAVDLDYQSQNGFRPNDDFENTSLSAKFKQQITAKDSVFLQVQRNDFRGGFLNQVFDNENDMIVRNPAGFIVTDRTKFRTKELQEPNVFVGYHREWSPGNHTLFLFSRLDDEFHLLDKASTPLIVTLMGNEPKFIGVAPPVAQTNRSDFNAYSAELQQILTLPKNTIIAGARFQTGDTDNKAALGRLIGTNYSGSFDTDLQRVSVYAYDYWQICDPLLLSAGVTYDHIRFPVNTDVPPLSGKEKDKDQVSPKIGLRYTPWENTSFRFAYTRSLGGLFFDQSVRLEPVQIAGFTQSYRSIIPESVAGTVAGTEFTTYGLGVEQRFPTKTYVTLEGQILHSEAERTLGAFNVAIPSGGLFTLLATPTSLKESLKYEERSITLSVNQLLGNEWALGAQYRLADAELNDRFSSLPKTVPGRKRDGEATLHQADMFVLYNHRCGFFARADVTWAGQDNSGIENRTGSDFWQAHLFGGYRFSQRQAEVRVGVLNLFDQDYRLNPLNFYLEYPRERTFYASLKINF